MGFPQFLANPAFLKYLSDVAAHPQLKQALVQTDYSSICVCPGLSEAERTFLKLVNWSEFAINPDPDLTPVRAGSSEICERKIGSGYVERGCWR